MTRRRTCFAVVLAGLALAAAWLVITDGLTADERQLVGTWTADAERSFVWDRCILRPDRVADMVGRSAEITGTFSMTSYWRLRAGRLEFDPDQNKLRRAFRPLLALMGRPVSHPRVYTVQSLGVDRMEVVAPDGITETWTRVTLE